MFDKNKIADDFSFAANNYGARAKLQAKIGESLIKKTTPHIVPDALLLDVGAGSGELTKHWPVARSIPLDFAVGMCEEAAKKNMVAINARAEQLPIQNEVVDVLASNLMLQWIPESERFFAESFRVLKPCGIFALTHFAEGTLAELDRAFTEAGQGARVSKFHAPNIITKQVRDAGFDIILESNETLQEKYYGVMDLCAFIRDIGASNKRSDRPRGLLSPRALRKVTAAYPREGLHITASWVVQTIVARKVK